MVVITVPEATAGPEALRRGAGGDAAGRTGAAVPNAMAPRARGFIRDSESLLFPKVAVDSDGGHENPEGIPEGETAEESDISEALRLITCQSRGIR